MLSKYYCSKMLQTKPDAVNGELINNFQRLNFTDQTGNMTNESSMQKSKSLPASVASASSSNVSGSVSSAGILQPSTKITPPSSRAQTAPTASANYYGFAYPYNFHYPNNLVYSNNNPMIPTSVNTGDQNPFQSAQNSYMRSVSPLPSAMSSSPVEGSAAKYSSDMRSNSSCSPQPVIPPRPVGYRNNAVSGVPGHMMYMPLTPVSASSCSVNNHRTFCDSQSGGVCSPPPPTISESPENSGSFHNQGSDQRNEVIQGQNIPRKDVNSQLYINVESTDTSNHDWRPFQTHSPHSHPLVPQMPFQLSPGFNNYRPIFQQSDSTGDQAQANMQMPPTPMYVPIPYPTLPYPPNFYYPIPTSGQLLFPSYEMNIQQYVYQQMHHLNALQYELRKDIEEIETHKKEIRDLEISLNENSFLPNKAEIDKLNIEISKLRLECYCLCAEVDEHYKGTVPLGEINGDFYSCINTGQDGPILSSRTKGRTEAEYPTGSGVPSDEAEENEEKSHWTCSECTFRNHPAINVCEVCQIGKNIACSS